MSSNIQNLELQLPRDATNPLEELVQCSLCIDKLKDPKMLICQHTFCLNCLQYYLPSGASQIECPKCKKTTDLINGIKSLEELPTNLYINSILKLIKDGNSPKTPLNKNPEQNCIKCQTIFLISEHTSTCQHCKQYFCGVCWPKHVTEILQNLTTLNEQLNEYQNRLNHRIDLFLDSCLQLEENIRVNTEIKIKEFEQRKDACLKEVNQIYNNGIKSSDDLRKRIEKLQENITDKNFNETTDDATKISNYLSIHRNTTILFDNISRWNDQRIIFNSDTFKIDNEIDASIDAEVDDDVTPNGTPSTNSLNNPDDHLEYYKIKSFAPKLTWNKCVRPAAVAINPWNQNCIYVAGTDSRYIYGFDKQKGKLLHRYSNPNMLCPVGLAFSDNEIYVSDKWKHCIHVFNKDGTYLRAIGMKGGNNGQLRSPEGIAYQNNRLFICDTGNNRIQVLNPINGKFLYSFGITGTGQAVTAAGFIMDFKYTELNMPTGIAVHNDRIFIADSGNRRIKIYNLDGNKITEFGSLGKSKGQFRSPEVLAVDSMGFILVGDSGNARVQIFRPNGTLVRVFGHKGKLAWVSGICVTPQMDIIVSDYKNHTVHIF